MELSDKVNGFDKQNQWICQTKLMDLFPESGNFAERD
jgi:hypothetical protein